MSYLTTLPSGAFYPEKVLGREPTHPGVILTSFMEHEEMTRQDLAERIDIPRKHLSAIINKRQRITTDTAQRLARVLDTSPEFWLNLQTKWDSL